VTTTVKIPVFDTTVSVDMTLARWLKETAPQNGHESHRKESAMDVTTIASLGAMFAGLTTLAIALNHWQRTYSRQQEEIRRLAASRSNLARKFVRQLRQARLYTNLENEYCERLASVADLNAATIKKDVRRHVEGVLADGTRHNSRYATESGIQDQIESVREMGFEVEGETVIETIQHGSFHRTAVAA
jgi:alkanesulfonate monooxygenase SsuD/methylene tetrahydromethanopterin reductase-like flavin-dependent oxidoreductase (luciferase family)